MLGRSWRWVYNLGVLLLVLAVVAGALSGTAVATTEENVTAADSDVPIETAENGSAYTATSGNADETAVQTLDVDDSCCGETEVSVAVVPTGESFPSDGTMPIIVGAVNRTANPETPVAGEELNITVERPDGTTESYSVTTDDGGSARVDYDLSNDNQNGTYAVTVSRVNGPESVTVEPDVGPAVGLAEDDFDQVLTGSEIDLTFLVRDGTFGVANEPVNISVEAPNGTVIETQEFETDSNGFVDISLTPQQVGRYDVTATVVGTGASEQADVEARKLIFGETYRNGEAIESEEFAFGGYLENTTGLVTDETIHVAFQNDSSDTAIRNITTTTGANGFFLVESTIDNPDGYDVDITTANGQSLDAFVYLDVTDPYDSGGDSGDSSSNIALSVEPRNYENAPGSNVTYDIEATENGSPIANEEVQVSARLDFDGPFLLSTTVTTDENGAAVVEVPTPSGVSGEDVDIDGDVRLTYNNTTVTEGLYADIQQYEYDYDPGYGEEDEVGSTVDFSVTASSIDGSSVENIPVYYNGLYDTDRFRSFTTGELVTNASGQASVPVAIPRDLRPSRGVEFITPSDSSTYVNMFEFPGTAEIIGTSETEFGRPIVEPGEQVTISFSTPNGSSASGVVLTQIRHNSTLNYAESTIGTSIGTNANVTVTIPEYADTDSFQEFQVVAADSEGRFYADEVFFRISQNTDSGDDNPIDVSLSVSPDSVEAGNEFTLTADANQSVEEYQWDFNNDGTIDAVTTNSSLTETAGYPDDYTISVTAVATDGDTATASTDLTITDSTAPTPALSGPSTVVIGEEVTFDASESVDNGYIANYTWEISTGTETVRSTTTTSNTTSFSFSETGDYTLKLTVTDSAGNTNTTTKDVTVVTNANLATSVEVEDSQRFDDTVSATINITNTGTQATSESFTVEYTYTGEYHGNDTVTSGSGTFTITQSLANSESIQRSVDLTDWVTDNRITGDVTLSADANINSNVTEARDSDNQDSATFEVTYADLTATISTPSVATNATATEIRAYVGNNGTATSSSSTVTITVSNSSGRVTSTTAPVGELATTSQNLTRITPTLESGTYTVTAEVSDATFPAGNTTTEAVTVAPYSVTAESSVVPDGLEVGQNSTVAFVIEANDTADVNATLSLNGPGLTFQGSNTDSVSKIITPEPDVPNVVTYDVQAASVTSSPESITFTANETSGASSATATDATNVSIVTETVTNSTGLVHKDTEVQGAISVYNDSVTQSHSVNISVQAGGSGRTLQGLEYLVNYPYGCVEQTTSAFLGALETDQYYRDRPDSDISDSRQERINGSIEQGINRLNQNGLRGQQPDGSWNMWGQTGVPGDTFYSVYALYGTTEVATDSIYGPKTTNSLDQIDFDQAITWLNDEDQNADGSFDAYAYIEDPEAMTGFTMVAVNTTAQTDRVSSATQANITELQGEGIEYLLSEQQSSGAWNNGDARSTALATRGLQVALENGAAAEADASTADIQAAIDDGKQWLIENQNEDGSWEPYHDSSFYNEEGDRSVTTAYAVLALNEAGVPAENATITSGTSYLIDIYEADGSWGYPRATAIAIEALDELTDSADSGTMTITFDGADGTVTETVTVNADQPEATITLDETQLETLRGDGAGTTMVNVTITDDGSSGTIIIGIESAQEITVGGDSQ